MSIKDIMESMDYGCAPEAATEAMAWLAARDGRLGHFIDGAFCAAEQTVTPVGNPATGVVLGHIPQAGTPEIDAAVAAAKAALVPWSRLPGFERARYLYAIARGLQKRERFFALLESLDTGMTSQGLSRLASAPRSSQLISRC
jgi:aldehyde dehydrogenase (NAD+)